MSFLNSSTGAGLKDFLHGHVLSGLAIHDIPIWYSDLKTMSLGVALDLVPRWAGLQLPSSHRYSFSTSLFTLTSLTCAPTNWRNLPDSVRSMPSTALGGHCVQVRQCRWSLWQTIVQTNPRRLGLLHAAIHADPERGGGEGVGLECLHHADVL
jgi:hypothetical protein